MAEISDWIAAIRSDEIGRPSWRARIAESSPAVTLKPSPTKRAEDEPEGVGGSGDVEIVNPRSTGPVSFPSLVAVAVSGAETGGAVAGFEGGGLRSIAWARAGPSGNRERRQAERRDPAMDLGNDVVIRRWASSQS
jgi:hypothetical protein